MTSTPALPSLKTAAFAILGALTLATILVHERYLLRPGDPLLVHLATFRWWLFPHIAGGMIALALGPLQFSTRLRRKNLSLHRLLGRVYAIAVLISSALSVFIVVRYEDRDNWWVMGAMGGLWFAATALAWLAIRRRDQAQHQIWMVRSYALTFTFVMTRFVPDVILPGLDYAGTTALYWAFITASLILPDLLIAAGVMKVSAGPARSNSKANG